MHAFHCNRNAEIAQAIYKHTHTLSQPNQITKGLLLHTKVGFLSHRLLQYGKQFHFCGFHPPMSSKSRAISITCNIIFYLALTANNPQRQNMSTFQSQFIFIFHFRVNIENWGIVLSLSLCVCVCAVGNRIRLSFV